MDIDVPDDIKKRYLDLKSKIADNTPDKNY
jgi:hypothetical protein